MTSPGGGGQDINLAALWVPVMPETSHMAEGMKTAGAEAKKSFEEGFNSSGSSPEQLGQNFSAKLQSSIGQGLKGIEIPVFGNIGEKLDKIGGQIDENLVGKLRGQATQAIQAYNQEWEHHAQLQQRATELNEQYNRTVKSGGDFVSIASQRNQVQQQLNQSHTQAIQLYGQAEDKLSSLGNAERSAAQGGEFMAGIMGGLVVAGVQAAVSGVEALAEKLIEGAVEAFKAAIETGKEFAETMVDLGDTYENISTSIIEYSTATGEKFEELEAHAYKVFNTLDVEGKNTGQTMAQFASILDAEPSPALDTLTRHVEELQGRFSTLRTTDLASIFVAFKTPLAETDSALASLLQSARNSGQDLGQLTAALSGDAAITLQQAGLNIEQAGRFMSELLKLGPSGRSVMTGLQAAMKDFAQEGLSFGDGMKLAGQRLRELGDTMEGQDLAEKLFGTRRWATAMAAAQQYIDVVDQGPEAFKANADSVDDFLTRSQGLSNMWDEIKHKAEAAFQPVGMAALKLVKDGLDGAINYVDTHMETIHHAIQQGGLYIIQFAKDAEGIAEGVLEFFGPVVNAIDSMFGNALTAMGTFTRGAGDVIGIFDKDKGENLVHAGNAMYDAGMKLRDANLGEKMHEMATWLKQHEIDVKDAGDAWMTFSDKVYDAMSRAADSTSSGLVGGSAGGGLGGTVPQGVFPPVSGGPMAGGGAGSGGGGPTPWFSHGPAPVLGPQSPVSPTDLGGLLGGGGNALQGGSMPPTPAPSNVSQSNYYAAWQAFRQAGFSPAEWPAYVQLEMSEAGFRTDATNPSSGAFGMGQFLGHENDKYRSGYSHDPMTQAATMMEYIKDRYGTPSAAWAFHMSNNWYDKGGGPRGTDTIPAWLSPGEYVWDKGTMDKFGWLVTLLHGGGKYFDQGGPAGGGGNVQVDTLAVQQAAQTLFGISDVGTYNSPDGYNEHASGEAADIMVGDRKDLGNQIAQYFLSHASEFGVQYVLWNQTQWNPDGSSSKMEDRGSPTKNHMDHVHVRTLGGGFPGGAGPGPGYAAPSSGATSAAPSPVAGALGGGGGVGGADGSLGGRNSMFPGLPGQYGGYGAYGATNYDQVRSAEKAVQEARDRQDDLNHQVEQANQRVKDLQDQIDHAYDSKKTGALGRPIELTPDERKSADDRVKTLREQLDQAKYDAGRQQREAGEQGANIDDALRKQQEAMLKPPGGGQREYKIPGVSEFTQLGGGLVKGMAQEFGFGDIFAKAPWDWGIVKLASGLANWGLGTANAWADEVGKGHTGMTGFQPMAGFDTASQGSAGLSGMLGALGVNMPSLARPQMVDQFGRPMSNVSTGPNITATQPTAPDPFNPVGGPTGPAPGPVIQGDYMPITVSPNVNPSAILGPVQEQRNSQNANLHGQTGGLPK